jgi:hypothetical protein
MRATEFIAETTGTLGKTTRQSGPYAKRYDDMDTYYDMYRLGIAIAGGGNANAEGPARASPTVWITNSVEEEKVKTAEQTLGKKGTVIVPKGPSEELASTSTVSPVASVKKNRYGI